MKKAYILIHHIWVEDGEDFNLNEHISGVTLSRDFAEEWANEVEPTKNERRVFRKTTLFGEVDDN